MKLQLASVLFSTLANVLRNLDHLPVVGYLRVSTDSPEQMVSVETQRLALNAVCNFLIEDVLSSSDFAKRRRPGWDELELLVAGPRVRAIRFIDLSRLARDGTDMDLIQMCHKQGVAVLDLNGKEWEIRTPDGLLLTGVTSLMNRVQSRMISAKVRGALKVRRAEGKLARGRLPFGYLHVDGAAVEHPAHWALARELVQRLLEAEMNINATVNGLPIDFPWRPSTRGLLRWWQNPMLRGGIGRDLDKESWIYGSVEWGRAPVLLTSDEWQTGQRMLMLRRSGQSRAGLKPSHRLFSGLIICSHCKRHLHYHPKQQHAPRYACRTSWCERRGRGLAEKLVKEAVVAALVEKRVQQMAAIADSEEVPMNAELSRLQDHLARLEQLEEEGLQGLHGQILRLRDEIAALRTPSGPSTMDAQLEEAFSDSQTLLDLSDQDLRAIVLWFVEQVRYLGDPKACQVVLRGAARVA